MPAPRKARSARLLSRPRRAGLEGAALVGGRRKKRTYAPGMSVSLVALGEVQFAEIAFAKWAASSGNTFPSCRSQYRHRRVVAIEGR